MMFLLLCSSSPIQALDTTPVPSNGSLDVNFYLTVYGSIAVANSLFAILRAFLFAYGTIHAATVIHNRLLQRALKVTVRKSRAGWGSCKSLCPDILLTFGSKGSGGGLGFLFVLADELPVGLHPERAAPQPAQGDSEQSLKMCPVRLVPFHGGVFYSCCLHLFAH